MKGKIPLIIWIIDTTIMAQINDNDHHDEGMIIMLLRYDPKTDVFSFFFDRTDNNILSVTGLVLEKM